MEFLKTVRKRSFLSHLLYVVMNIGLAIAILWVVRATGSLPLAFLIVVVSKWRVLAVRPRYWLANAQANLVDFIVSISFVVMLHVMHTGGGSDAQIFLAQIALVLLYIAWLLFLKPKSKRVYIAVQAGVALFAGVTALFMLSYDWIVTVPVIFMWLIGYATARHILSSHEEHHTALLSLVWGLVLAEIGWLAHHWTIAYNLPVISGVMIPQVSIIVLSLGFLVYQAYKSYVTNQRIRMGDIILPLAFTIGVISLLVLVFNNINTLAF